MTLKGLFFIVLFLGVVLGTAWVRWRLSYGPIRGSAQPGDRADEDHVKRGSSG